MAGSVFGHKKSLFGDESEIAGVDLNLTPLMDVMSNILFFLLASVGASVVALLPASLPTRSESASGGEPPVDQVLVNLQITEKGYVASASNERLTREQMAQLRFELPRGPKPAAADGKPADSGWELPYEELTRRLTAIKEKYRASDTVIILPESKVPYEVIIRTMDAARGAPAVPGAAPNPARPSNLFTKVVISDLVK